MSTSEKAYSLWPAHDGKKADNYLSFMLSDPTDMRELEGAVCEAAWEHDETHPFEEREFDFSLDSVQEIYQEYYDPDVDTSLTLSVHDGIDMEIKFLLRAHEDDKTSVEPTPIYAHIYFDSEQRKLDPEERRRDTYIVVHKRREAVRLKAGGTDAESILEAVQTVFPENLVEIHEQKSATEDAEMLLEAPVFVFVGQPVWGRNSFRDYYARIYKRPVGRPQEADEDEVLKELQSDGIENPTEEDRKRILTRLRGRKRAQDVVNVRIDRQLYEKMKSRYSGGSGRDLVEDAIKYYLKR
ncbi:hypothetical protein [Nisaea denitrificans]|uniref:hypothetical protein n=1 Tax=Nisaea denitrificans TaxID=390877 RepID=UPI000428B4C7|nr:hypothetical protein [Nisaea denitrificans]